MAAPSEFNRSSSSGHRLPLWLKIVYTLFTAGLIPIYTMQYGVHNFLWFSNVALLLTVPALWLESRLLASMMALAVVIPEIGWNLDFFIGLLFGSHPLGLTEYMFDTEAAPLFVRLLSLYHVPLPFLLIWLVYRLGYDRRALAAQTTFGWCVLLVTWLLTRPEENVNWVYGLGDDPQRWMPEFAWLLLILPAYALIFYIPTHVLLQFFFSTADQQQPSGPSIG